MIDGCSVRNRNSEDQGVEYQELRDKRKRKIIWKSRKAGELRSANRNVEVFWKTYKVLHNMIKVHTSKTTSKSNEITVKMWTGNEHMIEITFS